MFKIRDLGTVGAGIGVFLTLGVSGANAAAEPARFQGKLTARALTAFAQENQIAEPAELLRRLPDSLLSHFTLVPEGRSLQAKCADAENPRLILFSPADAVVMSFTNRSTPDECFFPEILELTPDGHLNFDVIDLYRVPSRAPVRASAASEKARCVECHGKFDTLRASPESSPIWGGYPQWLGALGSHDDFLAASQNGEEATLYQKFSGGWRSHGIYQYLHWGPTAYFPYSTNRQSDNTLRPNFLLGFLLARMDGRRLARRILEHPSYSEKSGRFLREHLRCDGSRPKEKAINAAELVGFGINPLGIKTRFDGYNQPTDFILVELMRAQAKGDATLTELLQPEANAYRGDFGVAGKVATPLSGTRLAKRLAEYCAFLAGNPQARPGGAATVADDGPIVTPTAAPVARPNPFNRCTSCHAGGALGPKIPFLDEGALAQALTRKSRHGTLYDEIVFRVRDARDDRRMPKGSQLDPDTELPDFLDRLSKLRSR